MRRLTRAFRSTDSYALVLLLIVATYAIAVNVQPSGADRPAPRPDRDGPAGAPHLARAPAGAPSSPTCSSRSPSSAPWRTCSCRTTSRLEPYMFVAATVLYFVAPIAIVRRIAFRREVDQETMLGALAAYLFFGMAFAFTYRYLGAVQNTPFFGSERRRLARATTSSSASSRSRPPATAISCPRPIPARAWPCSRHSWVSCSS